MSPGMVEGAASEDAGTVRVPVIGGTGLKGLAGRLAAAGGWLEAGPGPRGGFVVRAELPVESVEEVRADEPAGVVSGSSGIRDATR